VCHKPSTVSGGGKSEISKSIADAITIGNAYVADFDADMDAVEAIFERDYSRPVCRHLVERSGPPPHAGCRPQHGQHHQAAHPELGVQRGAQLPSSGRSRRMCCELVYVIKRPTARVGQPTGAATSRSAASTAVPATGCAWTASNVLVDMLRVGFESDGSYRLFSAAARLPPAIKVQTEDDITASTVVPTGRPR
jgi:hypothetical protein